ncbi:RVT_3 domain-containing protein, partial [Cephalotus follicularis]
DLVVVILWRLWNTKNNLVFGNVIQNYGCLVRDSIDYLRGFREQINVFESYCLNVITKINSEKECLGIYGTIVEDIKDLFGDFVSCLFVSISRKSNSIAHQLGHYALTFENDCSWKCFFPSWLNQFVNTDIIA